MWVFLFSTIQNSGIIRRVFWVWHFCKIIYLCQKKQHQKKNSKNACGNSAWCKEYTTRKQSTAVILAVAAFKVAFRNSMILQCFIRKLMKFIEDRWSSPSFRQSERKIINSKKTLNVEKINNCLTFQYRFFPETEGY